MASLTRRPIWLIWLVWLGLGLWTCGCAGGWPARSGRVQAPPAPAVEPPPSPAPALCIPSPPRPVIQRAEHQTLEVPVPIGQAGPARPGQVLPSESEQQLPALIALEPAPGAAAAAPEPSRALRQLYRKAAEQIAPMDTYALRLRRREMVNGRPEPEEVIHFKFRREPFSVYLKWIGGEAQGREVVYVKGRYENKIHSKMPASKLLPFPSPRLALPLDSMLVKSRSRHAITQAGLENLVERFGLLVDAQERKEPGAAKLRYLGALKRPELENTVEAVEHIIPPGADPLLPRGGQKRWYFDTRNHLPVLIVTHDDAGQEVEYYCHDRIEFPLHLTDDDFNPDRLWGKS